MNRLNVDIDELVGKIMADLRGSSSAPTAGKASAALSHDFSLLHAKESARKELESVVEADPFFLVSEQAIVLDVVRRLASSVDSKRWSIKPDAVITPSARDELKRLGIELIIETRAPVVSTSASNVSRETTPTRIARETRSALTSSTVPRVLIATHLPESERFPTSVREYLARNAETMEVRLDCLKETTGRIAEELKQDKELKAVLATHDAAIGSIWANRFSGVRAAVAFSFEQAKRDFSAANANVAIIDPNDVGVYQFRRIVDCFLRQ